MTILARTLPSGFHLCMTVVDLGWSIEATAVQLMKDGGKARENGERYAIMRVQNAAAAIERRQRSRA